MRLLAHLEYNFVNRNTLKSHQALLHFIQQLGFPSLSSSWMAIVMGTDSFYML